MIVIGCDFHPSWQQICWVDTVTGETEEKKLDHASGEADRFYRGGWRRDFLALLFLGDTARVYHLRTALCG